MSRCICIWTTYSTCQPCNLVPSTASIQTLRADNAIERMMLQGIYSWRVMSTHEPDHDGSDHQFCRTGPQIPCNVEGHGQRSYRGAF